MDLLIATAIAVLTAAAIYLFLRARAFEAILGFLLSSHAANLFVLSMSRPFTGSAPDLAGAHGAIPDPVPQALILTAIVINFGVTTFLIVLAVRSSLELGSDRLEGGEVDDAGAPE